MDRQTILLQARQAGVKLVRFLYCGNDGLIRGKAAAVEALDGALEAGIGLTVAMQSFTMLDRLAPRRHLRPRGRDPSGAGPRHLCDPPLCAEERPCAG